MDSQTINTLGNVMAYYSTPVGTAPLIENVAQGNAVDAAASTLQTVGGLIEMFGKNLSLGAGLGLAGTGLLNDARNLKNSYVENGTVSSNDIYSAASNLSSVVSVLALAGAAVGGTALSAPALIGVAAVATAAGAALTLAAMGSDEPIDIPALMENMKQDFQQLTDAYGGAYQDAVNALSDGFTQAADYVDTLLDSAKDVFLGLVDVVDSIADVINQFFNTSRTVVGGRRDPLALDLDGDTSSINKAALSAMRRVPQLGQKPRRLQLKATRCSA